MIKKPIKDLSELEKKLLLSYTIGGGSPTFGRAMSSYIKRFPDLHPADLRNALLSLVAHGYLKTIKDEHSDDSFFFTEDGVFEANKHFKEEVSRKVLNPTGNPSSDPSYNKDNWYNKPIGMIGIGVIIAILGAIAIYLIKKNFGIPL